MPLAILNNIKNINDISNVLTNNYEEYDSKTTILDSLPYKQQPFSVIITCTDFNDKDITKLKEILPKIQVPFHINLSGNDLQDKVENILDTLTKMNVPFNLDFAGNNIPLRTFQKSKYFLSKIKVPFEISFAYNEAQNQGTKYIIDALSTIQVSFTLNLKAIEFGNEAATYLSSRIPTIKSPYELNIEENDFDYKGGYDISKSMLKAKAPCKITADAKFLYIQDAYKNNIATMDSKQFFGEIVEKNNLPYMLLPIEYEKLFSNTPFEIQKIICSYFGFENIHNKYLSLIYSKNAIQNNKIETLQYDKLGLNRKKINNDNTELKSDSEEIHTNENSIKSKYSIQQKIHIIDNAISITKTCIDCYIHEKSLVTNPDFITGITLLAAIVSPTPFTISAALISSFIYSNDDFSIPLSSIATMIELEITKIISKSVPQMPFQVSLIGNGYIGYTTACATLKMLGNGYDLITNDLVHLYNHLFSVDESSYSQNITDTFDNQIDYTCDIHGKCTEHIDTY